MATSDSSSGSGQQRSGSHVPANSVSLPPTGTPPTPGLKPALGLVTGLAIVVGGVIGSGIFLKPGIIASSFLSIDSPGTSAQAYVPLILLLWILCGLVNLCGALTLAELGSMFPQAGGTYVFLREAYGRRWAFLWAWAEFWVIRSGSIAALAAAMLISLRQILGPVPGGTDPLPPGADVYLPILLILGLAAINIMGVTWGGWVQNLSTAIKVGFVILLALLPFWGSFDHSLGLAQATEVPLAKTALWTAVAGSLAAIMWAYDGWGNVTVVAEELKNPRRNVPLALCGGVLILIALYTAANIGYHKVLSMTQMAQLDIPAETRGVTAVLAMEKALGSDIGPRLMLAGLLISVFGAINSNVLVGPRVLYAVAKDHAWLHRLNYVHPRFCTPAVSIALLALWSCALIVLGSWIRNAQNERLFDILTNYCLFGGSLFYLAAVVAVFVLRRHQPNAPRPVRALGYPLVPLVFVLFYIFFLGGMLASAFKTSMYGLILISTGLLVDMLLPSALKQPLAHSESHTDVQARPPS